ncbi:MAG: ADOP family duplicated permease, partial [Gemmatimonadota bacterium]|nr:ADOP family duplicated permease [Gemmatimonadota bacterium]
MEQLLQNTRLALRTLLRSPGFTAVAVLTLALGIGATTAIFSVVNSVVLEPLDYPASDRLVHLEHPVPGLNPDWKWGLSEGGYFHLREHNRSFEEIGVYELWNLTLVGEGSAERVEAAAVSANLFGVLGGRPHLGRLLLPQENQRGESGTRVAVLDYDFWRTRFGADPAMVGSTIQIEGNPVEVVGVSAPGLQLPDRRTDLWMPVQIDPAREAVNWHRFQAVGRLRDGVTPDAAQSDLARLLGQFSEAMPNAYGGDFMERSHFAVEVEPLRSQVVGDIVRVLWVLLAAVGIVLLIACANVANLFLVRMEARRREVAVRTALGASRGDLALRYLTESVVVALLAGAGALLLAYGGIQLLLALSPEGIPRLSEIALGWKGVAFTALVALGTGVILGLLPSLRRGENFAALRQGARGMTASRGQNTVRGALVIGEIALALVLLAGAGLMLRTFQQLRSVDPGVDPQGVLTLDLSLPAANYRGYEPVSQFYQELSTRVAALPGVTAVGATQQLPLKGGSGCALVFTDDPVAQERNNECFASTIQVTPDYFRALGIPVRGSAPSWSDAERRSGEVVVSRALAERLWAGEDAIGKGIRGNGSEPPFYRIVGVAGDVRANGLDQPPVEQVYFPMLPIEGAPLWSPP